MEKGISLYPGLGMTREELVGRVEQAAQKGMTRLFLSFHIPETNEAAFQRISTPFLKRLGAMT